MGKDKNKDQHEERDPSENFEKFKNKKNNKWLRKKKHKNKKAYVEDHEEKKWS